MFPCCQARTNRADLPSALGFFFFFSTPYHVILIRPLGFPRDCPTWQLSQHLQSSINFLQMNFQ